jgi:hypothetical protein
MGKTEGLVLLSKTHMRIPRYHFHIHNYSLLICIYSFFFLQNQGASGVGIGNFEEIGPLDTDLKPRNSTWLRIADLLFVVKSTMIRTLL